MKRYLIKRTINLGRRVEVYYYGYGITFVSINDPYIKECGYKDLRKAQVVLDKMRDIHKDDIDANIFEIIGVNIE